MPGRKGAIIPSPENPSGTYKRVLCIPASPDWIALVTGALYVLTQPWYWDASTGDVDAIVDRAKQFYFEYQDQSGDCDPPMSVPIGTMVDFGSDTVPDGWLPCDGTTRLRADYPDLFTVIGTTFGFNDGTDFALPDCRNKSTYGLEYTDPTPARPVGFEDGTELVTLTEAQLPAHQHTTFNGSLYEVGTIGGSGLMLGATNSFPTVKTGFTGSNTPHSNLHPVLVVGKIIYAGV